MLDSRFTFNDFSRYGGWLVAGLFIFALSCSAGLMLSFFVTNGLSASLRNSPWYSTTLADLLAGVTLVLGSIVAGSISAFLAGKLFEHLARKRHKSRNVLPSPRTTFLPSYSTLVLSPAPSSVTVPC